MQNQIASLHACRALRCSHTEFRETTVSLNALLSVIHYHNNMFHDISAEGR